MLNVPYLLYRYLLPREAQGRGKSKCDGWVHVGAGDMADCVNHDGHNKPASKGCP